MRGSYSWEASSHWVAVPFSVLFRFGSFCYCLQRFVLLSTSFFRLLSHGLNCSIAPFFSNCCLRQASHFFFLLQNGFFGSDLPSWLFICGFFYTFVLSSSVRCIRHEFLYFFLFLLLRGCHSWEASSHWLAVLFSVLFRFGSFCYRLHRFVVLSTSFFRLLSHGLNCSIEPLFWKCSLRQASRFFFSTSKRIFR